MSLGMTVVSRLRKNAALWTVPGPRVAGRRGRPRIYGENRIDLAKRAGQRRGWTTEVFELYGKPAKKRYKTFVATWRPAGGMIRVVLVDEPDGGVAFFCTDPNATVAEILATVADRFSLEITFRDCKEIVGAGQQQVRFVWANIGAFHICLWTFTMTEAWAWGREDDELVNREASPWDDPNRRPSHADKRRAWRRELLAFLKRLEDPRKHWKFSAADLFERGFWDEYMKAYEEALSATSTKWAPWYIIPANHKWVTRGLVARIVTSTSDKLDLRYPEVSPAQETVIEQARNQFDTES